VKEPFHLVKINWQNKNLTQNLSLIFISIGLFCLGFSKIIQLDNPDFYFGKFNSFQNLQISLSTLFLFIGSSIKIIFSKLEFRLSFKIAIFCIFLISTFLYKDINSFNYLTAALFFLSTNKLSLKQFKFLVLAFTSGVLIQVFIGIFQFINQQSTNLTILHYLGEPNLYIYEKGISKLSFKNFEFIRPYGTTYHPNFLGGLIAITIIFNKKFNDIIFYLGLIFTQSLSAIIGTGINLFLRKKKVALTSILILGATILTFKLGSTNYTGIIERLNQNLSILELLKDWNISNWIFGSKNTLYLLDIQKLLPWEVQPYHNHFVQIFLSYGLLGLTTFFLIIKNIYTNNKNLFYCILPVLLLDHYFITLPNGIFVLTFILLVKKPLS
jgi:hypothetical protein